jgi:hypothetical protein
MAMGRRRGNCFAALAMTGPNAEPEAVIFAASPKWLDFRREKQIRASESWGLRALAPEE